MRKLLICLIRPHGTIFDYEINLGLFNMSLDEDVLSFKKIVEKEHELADSRQAHIEGLPSTYISLRPQTLLLILLAA